MSLSPDDPRRQQLLEAVQVQGSLSAASEALGWPERTARYRWRAWQLPPLSEVEAGGSEVAQARRGRLGPHLVAAIGGAVTQGQDPYREALRILLGAGGEAAIAGLISRLRRAAPGDPRAYGGDN